MRIVKPALRHPPPPPTVMSGVMVPSLKTIPTPMANIEDEGGNSEIGVGKSNRVYGNKRSRPYYFRRCKEKRCLFITDMESLPDELVFEILLHLPAEYIYEAAMLVCRKWYNTIRTHNFIYSHLEHSTSGIIMHQSRYMSDPIFIAMVKGRAEISKFHYEFVDLCICSCNGLTLEHCISRVDRQFCIANPATKRHFYLPQFPTSFEQELVCSAIAYTAASMEYKVVCPGVDKTSNSTVCAILTVGVDSSWRNVRTEHLSLAAKRLFLKNPFTYEGFIHWPDRTGTHFLTLNVETEIITETRVPPVCNGTDLMYYLSSGRSLTVLVECSGFSWDAWELTKPENGEWTKIAHIDLEGRKWKFEELVIECGCNIGPFALRPVGWLNYAQVLVLHISYLTQVCILYDVVSQEIDFLDLGRDFYWPIFRFYRSSLVWLDG